MSERHTDRALVERFQAGDESAYAELVRRHHERIYRLALALLASPADAADVTQEVFLRALTGLKGFRFAAAPFTWLYRTTKNVCREYNRKTRRQPLRELDESDPSIETVVETGQVAQQVRGLVSGLPERQRDVVMLRIFEDLSVEQTAVAMGCRPGTVKALLHKAIKRLRSSSELFIEDVPPPRQIDENRRESTKNERTRNERTR